MSEQVSYRSYSGTAAENYQRYFVPTIAGAVAGDLLAAADLQPGERVCDLACGTGLIARLAAEQVGPTGRVTGVDVAPDMIEVAAAQPAPAGATIDWRQSPAESLDLADDSCDVVLCQMGLMFFDDKPAALAHTRRVLAPGGRLVVNTPGTIQAPFAIMDAALARHISPQLAGFVGLVFSMDDPDALAQLLRGAGFERVETSTTTTRLRLPAPVDFLWQYLNLTPMGQVVNAAPEHAQTALEDDVASQWKAYTEEGGLVVDQPMIIATAHT